MDLDYSFNMWLPREQLFDAFSIIARLNANDELGPLIWPDGRRLPLAAKCRPNDSRDPMPVDVSLESDTFNLSFKFEADDALEEYAQSERVVISKYGPGVHIHIYEDESYQIGCIRTSIKFIPDSLDDEPLWARITFAATTLYMGKLFRDSTNVQQFFVALARSINAVSCSVSSEEEKDRLLFLDGNEVDVLFDNELNHPRFLRPRLGASWTSAQLQSRFCRTLALEPEASSHEILEVQLLARSEDAGIRIAALRAWHWIQQEESLSLLRVAVSDDDWRVRASVAYLLGAEDWNAEEELLLLLCDVHPEVRIAAALRSEPSEKFLGALQDILLSIPPIPENLGLIKAALATIARSTFWPHSVDALEMALELPDFPFKNMAAEKLKRLRP